MNAVKEKNSEKLNIQLINRCLDLLDFLPFDNHSLIIVDEEHEPSFKTTSSFPRYCFL